MNRTPLRVAVVAVALACAGALVPAASSAPVTRDDFVSVSQVAAQYPQFRGGGRSLLPGQQILIRHGGDCIGYEHTTSQPGTARIATYTKGTDDTGFIGSSSLYSGVYLFESRRAAGLAFDELLAAARSCWERPGASGYARTKLSPLRMPQSLHESFAYRVSVNDPDTGKDWFVQTWVRKGRYLVNLAIERDHRPPAAKPAYRLTRAAARTVGHG